MRSLPFSTFPNKIPLFMGISDHMTDLLFAKKPEVKSRLKLILTLSRSAWFALEAEGRLSICFRYSFVAAATYSALFILPSIFTASTPISAILSTQFASIRSLGLIRYPALLYCFRQLLAQIPLLPLRFPIREEIRHWPEYEMHRWPCTNISSFSLVLFRISRISSRVNSRASTTWSKSRNALIPW